MNVCSWQKLLCFLFPNVRSLSEMVENCGIEVESRAGQAAEVVRKSGQFNRAIRSLPALGPAENASVETRHKSESSTVCCDPMS